MNNKKITITFILMSIFILLGIIGFTVAYFTSSTDFENEFQTGVYQTTATEVFESPENWLPGDTTPKELTITNTGNVDVKARVCIDEEWTSSNDDTLPNEVGGVSMAIINLDNTSDWTKKGNCYEYNDILEPNDTTSSFIQSVTFNPAAEASVNCTTTTNNGTTTKECTSTGNGYDNATYKLTLRVETVQANKASELWSSIQYVYKKIENQITIGDEISIGGEHFYVVNSDQNETVLLSKYGLSYEPEGLEEFAEAVEVPFSSTNYWDNSVCEYDGTDLACTGTEGLSPEYSQNGATYYDQSNSSNTNLPYVYRNNVGNNVAPSINYEIGTGYVQNNGYTTSFYVEKYINKLKQLGAPNSIEGRLLRLDEIVNLGCEIGTKDPGCYEAPSWVYLIDYWLGTAQNVSSIISVRNSGTIVELDFYNSVGIRPVIEIPTSELEDIPTILAATKYIPAELRDYESGVLKIGNNVPDDVILYNTPEDIKTVSSIPMYIELKIIDDVIVDAQINFVITEEDVLSHPSYKAGTYSLKCYVGYDSNNHTQLNQYPNYQHNKNTIIEAFGTITEGDSDLEYWDDDIDFYMSTDDISFIHFGSCSIAKNGEILCGVG